MAEWGEFLWVEHRSWWQEMVSRSSQVRSQGALSTKLQMWNIFTLRSYQTVLIICIMWPDLHFWKLAIATKCRISWQNQGDQLGNYCEGSSSKWWEPSLRQRWREKWEHLKRYLGDGMDMKWWLIDKWGRVKFWIIPWYLTRVKSKCQWYTPSSKHKRRRESGTSFFSFSVSSVPEVHPGQPEGEAESHSLWLFIYMLKLAFPSSSATINILHGNAVSLVGQRKFLAFLSSCFP